MTPTTSQPIFAARIGADGAVLDATPVELVSGVRSNTPFALASDGAGALAVAYGRAAFGGVVRPQVRVFTWDSPATDGGIDAATDLGAPDAATPDVADAPVDAAAPSGDGGGCRATPGARGSTAARLVAMALVAAFSARSARRSRRSAVRGSRRAAAQR